MIYIYDGSYEGLLSCIFGVFKAREVPVAICAEGSYQPSLLDSVFPVVADEAQAARVLEGINARTHGQAGNLIYKIFLSELPQSEMLVYQVIAAIVKKGNASILENFANQSILKAKQIEKMMHREVHRMHAFVRFQKSREGLFYAAIDPDFNVLPLIGDHFERRYADQPWLIFDTRRHYGLHYDSEKTSFVDLDNPIFSLTASAFNDETFQDDREKEFQALWKKYFNAVNIRERNNRKLHLRHMPRRYWKYLIEKY
jgi:probable DNA metabolism protein